MAPNAGNRTTQQILDELRTALKADDEKEFADLLYQAVERGVDLDRHAYHRSSSKRDRRQKKEGTLLELALAKWPKREKCLSVLLSEGAVDVNRKGEATGKWPIHVAAETWDPKLFRLLVGETANTTNFMDKSNRRDSSATIFIYGGRGRSQVSKLAVENEDGLNACHILIRELAHICHEGKRDAEDEDKFDDEAIYRPRKRDIEEILECLAILFTKDVDGNLNFKADTSKMSGLKKTYEADVLGLAPLEAICSLDMWSAAPIKKRAHRTMERIAVSLLIPRNGRGSLDGSETPLVLLAARHGYYGVMTALVNLGAVTLTAVTGERDLDRLAVEKNKHDKYGYLVEEMNAFHVALAAGLERLRRHGGGDAAHDNVKAVEKLLEGLHETDLHGLLNMPDAKGNTPLFYATPYPDQEIVCKMLVKGANFTRNEEGSFNVIPDTLREFLDRESLTPKDDNGKISRVDVSFGLFHKKGGEYKTVRRFYWAPAKRDENNGDFRNRRVGEFPFWTRIPTKVTLSELMILDTDVLLYLHDEPAYRELLRHPVVDLFLEVQMQLTSHAVVRFTVFLAFLLFVVAHYAYVFGCRGAGHCLSDKFPPGLKIGVYIAVQAVLALLYATGIFILKVHNKSGWGGWITPLHALHSAVIIAVATATVILGQIDSDLMIYLAALNLVLSCLQLYRYFEWILPNVVLFRMLFNMFTKVLWTYTKYLGGYSLLISSFAAGFYMVFSPVFAHLKNAPEIANATSEENEGSSQPFHGYGYSLIKTLVMFVGEMEYTAFYDSDTHVLAYALLVSFVFLSVIVLMNVLNGLAISDVGEMLAEADMAGRRWKVQSLGRDADLAALKVAIGDPKHGVSDRRPWHARLFHWNHRAQKFSHEKGTSTGCWLSCKAVTGIYELAQMRKEKKRAEEMEVPGRVSTVEELATSVYELRELLLNIQRDLRRMRRGED